MQRLLLLLVLLPAAGCHFDLLSGDPGASAAFQKDAADMHGYAWASKRYRHAERISTVTSLALTAAGFAFLAGAVHERAREPGSPAVRNLALTAVGFDLASLGLGLYAFFAADRAHEYKTRWYEGYRESLARDRRRKIASLVVDLGSPDRYVRKNAAEALGELDPLPLDAVPELKRVAETDPEPYLRLVAEAALRKVLGTSEASR